MLNWANRFSIFCLLDNHQYEGHSPAFECLLATGCRYSLDTPAGQAFGALSSFCRSHPGEWIFGHLGYDLKNESEPLHSGHHDGIGYSDLFFFIPEVVLRLDRDALLISCDTGAEEIYRQILSCPVTVRQNTATSLSLQQRISRSEYLAIIDKLKQHILRGDCYEINFCQEFYAENAVIDPLFVYQGLSDISPNPFSAMYKLGHRYCLCASPERYLKKKGMQLFSQPIKGTTKRDLQDRVQDEAQKRYLLESEKERSENIMVVDLVRNDLSRICRAGSVKVEELFGIYSFPQVHQMISTISGELNEGLDWVESIKATFPMGSMTGAPKKRVMELIEEYERTKRGLFSGAIGYIEPGTKDGEGPDFDFNVVIRSIFFNEREKYLSFQAGGGITFNSDPEKEYEECLLKAEAIRSILK